MNPSADLTFIHLSDIHFRKDRVGTRHDADETLRDELVSDLRELAPHAGRISGIIITGDIAWSGHTAEYTYAESWIRSVAEQLQCSLSDVMVTPGNHDIYRPELKRKSGRIERLQQRVRKGGNPATCVERLTEILSGDSGKLLTAPLRAYNGFAKQFDCAISPQKPYWERPFKLGNGTTLIVRGITSTWLSGPSDTEKTRRLVYGAAQYNFKKVNHTHYVVAGHHPPDNMIDGVDASKSFDFSCKLQLFGHKHDMWITQSRTCAKIVAGALHPDRREKPWIPRYNVIEISGELRAGVRSISLSIYPRRWSEEFNVFMADYTPSAKDSRDIEFLVG